MGGRQREGAEAERRPLERAEPEATQGAAKVPGRRTWRCGTRVHLALRQLDDAEQSRLGRALEEAFANVDGVHWVRVNRALERIVVDHDAARCSPEQVIERVAAVEAELGLDGRPPAEDVFVAGDEEPLRRITLEMLAEGVSLALTSALRRSKALRWTIDVDLAALLALLEGIPSVHAGLERALTQRGAELLLELSHASVHTVLRSEMGPVAALLRHLLALREAQAQRDVWSRREGELCGRPEAHERARRRSPGRPTPLRPGVIEGYEASAVPAALSTFAAQALLTGNLEASCSALLGGLPRAARLGRWAFTAQLVRVLAERDVLVFDREALERLDRIDFVLLSAETLPRDHPAFDRLLQAARAADLEIRVFGSEKSREPTGRYARPVSAPHLEEAVQGLQRKGKGVLLVHRGPSPAYVAADLSIALSDDGAPWGAHVIARRGWDDAALLVEAIPRARAAAEHSVGLALGEAATALSLLFGGLHRTTTRRIMATATVASSFAVGNALRLARAVRRAPLGAGPERRRWHAMSCAECLEHFEVDPKRGLSEEQVAARRPPRTQRPSAQRLLARKIGAELSNPMTPILAGGAVLSALVGSVVDAGLIGGALGMNAVLGGVQGFRTEQAVVALERREERPLRVRRAGRVREIPDGELVPGDILLLEAGDVVPADCRILAGSSVEVDESSLTGESQPVEKRVDAVDERAPLAERASMLYEGSSVNVGSVEALVVATGDATEAGRARLAGREGEGPVGVEARLQYLSRLTAPVAGLSALAMTASGLGRRRPLHQVVTSAVGLGVASVPEGLPLLATLAQLAAAERLSGEGALVRNPRALEALGRMDVLCADKTGTLTEGRIQLRVVSDGASERALSALEDSHRHVLELALQASPLPNGDPLPHPTDQSLVEGAQDHDVRRSEERERLAELPFEPARGLHASLERLGAEHELSVKGAPEVVLPRARQVLRDGRLVDLDPSERERWKKRSEELAGRGYRVLAVARRAVPQDFELDDDSVRDLVLCGFLGYADPVRDSAREAIAELGRAGVRVVMITGDHPGTAESIARELGLLNGHGILTGTELDDLDDGELGERIDDVAVFARVAPLQKVRIVRVLQARGHAVGMTGDGANDAPAIQLADVGIALGEGSTSAARGAADLLVSDGRIETILRAVTEGRALWTRVRDAVSILVGGNLGEIAFTMAGGVPTGRSPLNARQLLLVNLLTDSLPALAIAVRPPSDDSSEAILRAGPETSLGQELERDMMLRGLVTATAAGLARWLSQRAGAEDAESSTVGLLTLTSTQLGQTFVSGGRSAPVIAASLGSLAVLLAIVEARGVSQFFGCQPLGLRGLGQAAGVSALATLAARLADPEVWDRLSARIEGRLEAVEPGPAASLLRAARRLRPGSLRPELLASAVQAFRLARTVTQRLQNVPQG